jgi:hypothetical protein
MKDENGWVTGYPMADSWNFVPGSAVAAPCMTQTSQGNGDKIDETEEAIIKEALAMSLEDEEAAAIRESELEMIGIQRAMKTMEERLIAYSLRIHPVPGDGNCQFHSVAHQLNLSRAQRGDGDASKEYTHTSVRGMVTSWLKENSDLDIGNSTTLKEYVHGQTWESYWESMTKQGFFPLWSKGWIPRMTPLHFVQEHGEII